MENSKGSSRRGLKIFCGVTAIFLIIVAVVFVSLAFTIFKPKDPQVFLHPSGLENLQLANITSNVTMDMVITIGNPNYGSFKFRNSTGYVNYRGDVVGEIPVAEDLVPARSKTNITTSADLMAGKIMTNPEFFGDFLLGNLNMTATAVLHGKVSVLKIFNLHATTFTTCYISVFVNSRDIQSTCKSKIKL
ncbi:uncharacterized protein LOC8264283 [Ricinus communis]|uniref:Late embryogenesis abundant protein LEA-2 subgroup domain-containing protein n=1 Tax=Ricinus communis TaxID=3988 RepID=B9SUS5_RICCO|nr:uncharacterized protein LOC8264283 [Ricinus communis]EEF32651.1 conserved hypothetical protein [Ricinus communis]|eukprot:XP_002529744.1 uncharacterized protein LOC8264283 [Ricinus communis]